MRPLCLSVQRIGIIEHTQIKIYTCVFGVQLNYIIKEHHNKTHIKDPFKFSQCSATFFYASILKQHYYIHTGEKPFIYRK